MSILDEISNHSEWQQFLEYKKEKQHLTGQEQTFIENFILQKRYLRYAELIKRERFPSDFPHKKIVNKEGTDKKRTVYSFGEDEALILRFIAYKLYVFDDMFERNCYAFRRGYGVKDAIRRFRGNIGYAGYYCFKADISNYFNSIDIDIIMNKLEKVRERDEELYKLFAHILREDRVYENGKIISEKHGAMAGTPISPFLANIYLSDMDRYFFCRGLPYFRYSDDILIFAETEELMQERINVFYEYIKKNKLSVNSNKVMLAKPYEPWEFLGFSYNCGKIDLSDNTMRKIKAKIKRKSDALRRWQRKKGLTSDKAAKGFINAMNRKFYGSDNKSETDMSDDFTWSRWFFPNITEDKSLKEIDRYMQEYIRYIITGRHYKGNYRITYDQIKEWGYRSLVHEYYRGKENDKKETGTGNNRTIKKGIS